MASSNSASSTPLSYTLDGPAIGRAVDDGYRDYVITARGYHLRVSALWYLQLSGNKFVYLSSYKGKLRLHIREFKTDSVTKYVIPTPKGINFSKQQCRDFLDNVPILHAVVERDQFIKEKQKEAASSTFKLYDNGMVDDAEDWDENRPDTFEVPPQKLVRHVGCLLFAEARPYTLDLKQFYMPEDKTSSKDARYSRSIRLNRAEVQALVEGVWSITDRWNGLRELAPCPCTHKSPAERISCDHCSPTHEETTEMPQPKPKESNGDSQQAKNNNYSAQYGKIAEQMKQNGLGRERYYAHPARKVVTTTATTTTLTTTRDITRAGEVFREQATGYIPTLTLVTVPPSTKPAALKPALPEPAHRTAQAAQAAAAAAVARQKAAAAAAAALSPGNLSSARSPSLLATVQPAAKSPGQPAAKSPVQPAAAVKKSAVQPAATLPAANRSAEKQVDKTVTVHVDGEKKNKVPTLKHLASAAYLNSKKSPPPNIKRYAPEPLLPKRSAAAAAAAAASSVAATDAKTTRPVPVFRFLTTPASPDSSSTPKTDHKTPIIPTSTPGDDETLDASPVLRWRRRRRSGRDDAVKEEKDVKEEVEKGDDSDIDDISFVPETPEYMGDVTVTLTPARRVCMTSTHVTPSRSMTSTPVRPRSALKRRREEDSGDSDCVICDTPPQRRPAPKRSRIGNAIPKTLDMSF